MCDVCLMRLRTIVSGRPGLCVTPPYLTINDLTTQIEFDDGQVSGGGGVMSGERARLKRPIIDYENTLISVLLSNFISLSRANIYSKHILSATIAYSLYIHIVEPFCRNLQLGKLILAILAGFFSPFAYYYNLLYSFRLQKLDVERERITSASYMEIFLIGWICTQYIILGMDELECFSHTQNFSLSLTHSFKAEQSMYKTLQHTLGGGSISSDSQVEISKRKSRKILPRRGKKFSISLRSVLLRSRSLYVQPKPFPHTFISIYTNTS